MKAITILWWPFFMSLRVIDFVESEICEARSNPGNWQEENVSLAVRETLPRPRQGLAKTASGRSASGRLPPLEGDKGESTHARKRVSVDSPALRAPPQEGEAQSGDKIPAMTRRQVTPTNRKRHKPPLVTFIMPLHSRRQAGTSLLLLQPACLQVRLIIGVLAAELAVLHHAFVVAAFLQAVLAERGSQLGVEEVA